MSTPDDPTRRLPPVRSEQPGAPPPPREREREVVHEDPAWRAYLDDQLRTIRGILFGIGLVALVALALGVYLLATDEDDDDDSRAGASRTQVRALEDRVDKLQSRLGNRAGEGDVEELADAQSELAERLDSLEQEAAQADDGDTAQLEQAVEDLSGDLQQLSQRVDEVEQEQQQQP